MAMLDSIPNEILLLILGNLSHRDLKYSIPLVCKDFYSLIAAKTKTGKIDITLFRDQPVTDISKVKSFTVNPGFSKLRFVHPRFPEYKPPHLIFELNPSHTNDQYLATRYDVLEKLYSCLPYPWRRNRSSKYRPVDGFNAVSPAANKITLIIQIAKKPAKHINVYPLGGIEYQQWKRGARAIKYYDVINHIAIAMVDHARAEIVADKGRGLSERINPNGQMGVKGGGTRKAYFVFKWEGTVKPMLKKGKVCLKTGVEYVGKIA